MGRWSLKFEPEFRGEYGEPDRLTRHLTGLTRTGEITRIEWDSAGTAERTVEIRRRPNPGSGGGPETVENRTRLGRRAATALDRAVRIDRAIVEAIDAG